MAPSRRSTHPLPRDGSGDDRTRYASGTPWEPKVGYSRALRVGSHIYVSGTTATGPDGSVVGRGDAYAQTVQALDNVERALTALGSRREEIVRVRVYVTDMGDFEAIARALAERFGEVRPANTLVQVAALIDPAMKVEIDADAEVPAER
jgi:enamine deaminase RidA (YjgF/YER057c/UK114 family)